MANAKNFGSVEVIPARILTIRGQRVMIDADLAELYGVPTRALNQAVKRNPGRFPQDFMFQLSTEEKAEVVTSCDHLAKLKYAKSLPFAFTEHGAIQAANMLNSPQAIEMGIYVVRAFVRMRAMVATHQGLAKRLTDLEEKTEALALQQDTLAHNTRVQLKQVVETIRQLTVPPDPPKRPIGFTTKLQSHSSETGE